MVKAMSSPMDSPYTPTTDTAKYIAPRWSSGRDAAASDAAAPEENAEELCVLTHASTHTHTRRRTHEDALAHWLFDLVWDSNNF